MQRQALALVTVLGFGSAAAQETPRTPWGHPDFQGTWTNATLTPLQRPTELGAKEFYTPAELAEFAAQRRAATNADRPLRAGDVGSYNDVFFERDSELLLYGSGNIGTGRIPALTAAAQTAVEQILVEMNHDARVIPLDGQPHTSPAIEQWVGDSRGRFEGDTLVVETRNLKFNEQSRFGVGYLNGLSDENLRVVEHFTRTAGDTIMYQATIEDPTIFTSPWTVEIPLQPSEGAIYEVACHEGNLGLANILSGHRAEERAAAR